MNLRLGDRVVGTEPAIEALGAVFVPGRVVEHRDDGLVGPDTLLDGEHDLLLLGRIGGLGEVVNQLVELGILVAGRREAVAALTHVAGVESGLEVLVRVGTGKVTLQGDVEVTGDQGLGPDGGFRGGGLGVQAQGLQAFDPDLDGVDPVGPAVRYQHLELDLLAARGVEELVAVTVLVARLFQQGLGPFQVELVVLAVFLLDVRVVPGSECLAKP